MTELLVEYFAVVVSYMPGMFIRSCPMWKTRDVKAWTVYLFYFCLFVYIFFGLWIFKQFKITDFRTIQLFRFIAFIPSGLVPFLFFRKRIWMNMFLWAVAFMYGPISTGIGNYAGLNYFTEWSYPFLGSSIVSFAVMVLSLPPLIFVLRRLCENACMKQAKIWKYIWLLPTAFFALFMLTGNQFNPDAFTGSAFFIIRALIYIALLLTCFLLDSSLRQVAEAERIKAQEQALALENAALDRVNQLKTDLMRTISHETLTPLAVIMGFAEITAENARNDKMNDDFIANLDAIADETKRMAAMMEEMRQLALAKDYHRDRQPVDISKTISQVAGLYRKIFEQKNITFSINVPDGLPPVFGNGSELIQVIFNLLRNSDKHTDSGSVSVCVELTGGFIRVTVSDTGTGITPELLPRVFERGVHGENDGSGFGLSISRDIIAAYGGEIWIESRTDDGESGTKAIFTLPLCSAGAEDVDS